MQGEGAAQGHVEGCRACMGADELMADSIDVELKIQEMQRLHDENKL